MPTTRPLTNVTVLVAVVALVAAAFLTSWLRDGNAEAARVADVPLADRHLPAVVNAPGTWSDEEGVRGPVAALGLAMRTRPDGIFGERQSVGLFAVSAVDGSASWIRLPGFSVERWGFVGGFDVSPDGQWIGWVRPQRPADAGGVAAGVAGWAVMNTMTGKVRRLQDPQFPSVRGTVADLDFSGDSRHLLTSYETPTRPAESRSRTHQLVAWNVEDGAPTVVEPPGHYWLPSLGSAPTGVVWARDRRVVRVDPATGERTTLALPHHVVTAAWGPDDTSFAYVGRRSGKPKARWRLYAGTDVEEARNRAVDLPSGFEPRQLLGWRDATHVVVGHYRTTVHVVDVASGDVEAFDMRGYGDQVNAPYLAEVLWQQPLLAPTAPEGTADPRQPWRWGAAGLLVALGVMLLLRLRRRRR